MRPSWGVAAPDALRREPGRLSAEVEAQPMRRGGLVTWAGYLAGELRPAAPTVERAVVPRPLAASGAIISAEVRPATLPSVAHPRSAESHDRQQRVRSRRLVARQHTAEPPDEPPLPRSLHRTRRVVLPDVGHRLAAGHTVENCQAGQRRAGAAVASRAADLDPFSVAAQPCLTQSALGERTVGREPEVGPSQPSRFPCHRRRLMIEQVERQIGSRARG